MHQHTAKIIAAFLMSLAIISANAETELVLEEPVVVVE